MLELTLVLLGAILVAYGWNWGGVTESRTTGVVTGALAIVLAGVAAFGEASLEVWSLAALGAAFGGLVALTSMWESGADRTLGLYSLFLALASILTVTTLTKDADFETPALAATILAITFGLIFISAGLTPAQRGFRAFVGWVTLIAGALVAFLGYAPGLDITLN